MNWNVIVAPSAFKRLHGIGPALFAQFAVEVQKFGQPAPAKPQKAACPPYACGGYVYHFQVQVEPADTAYFTLFYTMGPTAGSVTIHDATCVMGY